MAAEIRVFSPTIPAGTLATAGWSSDLSFPPREVQAIQILVPPGPRGAVGFSIGSAGTPIIPANPGQWIVTDNERIDWPLEGQHNSGAWTFYGYNTGSRDHTVYVRFLLGLVAPPSTTIAPLTIPAARLQAAT